MLLLLLACTPDDDDDDGSKPHRRDDTDTDTFVWPDTARDSGGDADTDTDTDTDTDVTDTGWPADRDSDADGASDDVEGRAEARDTDGDGTPDYLDTDSDADGLLDADEGDDDWDGDGVANRVDTLNDGPIPAILFEAISTEFNAPIGIDFHEATGSVVLSVNYPTGDPVALERVAADGTHVTFSALSGVTDEVKIATARSTNTAGFTTGDLFVGNGVDGQIVRVSADGATIDNPWVDLGADTNGLMRGSLYVDRTGVFGDELLVATTDGELWRVDSVGTATLVADLGGVHLEGLITVPDAPARFGPLAGKAIMGAEAEGLLYAVAPDGSVTAHDIGVYVEDLEIVTPYENFFGVNYGSSRLVGASAREFLPMAGDILVTQESVTTVGLFRLYWDGASLHADELTAASGSATIAQWEHVTFAAAGIQEVPNE